MPPQPGMFALPFAAAHHKVRAAAAADGLNTVPDLTGTFHNMPVASSSRIHANEEIKKDKKRREIAGKLGKEMSERRDDGRHYAESISMLHSSSIQLATRPHTSSAYILKLYPLSLERSALLGQLSCEEEYALENVKIAWEEERIRVEEEFKKGRERIRERLLEGIEERRRRARDEKDGEGIGVGDTALDTQTRSHVTRKLRNKMGSPPPTPYSAGQVPLQLPATVVPVPNPHSLSVDELPSPFPLPLTSSTLPSSYSGANGKRRTKAGGVQPQALTGLGKAITQLSSCKEGEVESDLGEIRRAAKRRRAAAAASKQ